MATNAMSKAQLITYVRARLDYLLIDDSDMDAQEVAIYTLSDPRDIRQVRYVGQTRSARRRYLQHIRQARLWLPDEIPWWIKLPELRPLYGWIRDLYRDEHRLPVMVIATWTNRCDALQQEQQLIQHCLSSNLPILNREACLPINSIAVNIVD